MVERTDGPGLAPFGLEWDLNRRSVRERFGGLNPIADVEHALSYALIELAERVWGQGGFCPSVLMSTPERSGDEATFQFSNDQLNAVYVSFGYGFGQIGQDPDTLSEQAMSALARAEFHKLIFELAVKYGAPQVITEVPSRAGAIHVLGVGLFESPQHGLMQLVFGHDGGSALLGELWYHARRKHLAGF